MSNIWFNAAEIAAAKLPDLPHSERGIQLRAEADKWQARARKGRGVPGFEYHMSSLPIVAQATLAKQIVAAAPAPKPAGELGEWFNTLSDKKKDKARERYDALLAVEALVRSGMGKVLATMLVAVEFKTQRSTIYNWEKLTRDYDRQDWVAALASRHVGSGATAECEGAAWDFIRVDFLRAERPSFTACYRRLQAVAAEKGWTIPAARTLERRLLALPEGLRVLAREGADALKRMYPAQQRDRSVFHALEAVNADGHKWDVFVKWPDGTIGRPMMVAFQDLYSGKMLSWRVDRSENKDCVLLAFGDMVEAYGIPDYCWLDNGRSFASKWLTGGTATRYRFKVREADPEGVLTQLGVQVHWTTPYAGQSKPIERAFRDFAGDLAKHPEFAGAYVGNSPMAKPENYGSKAIPLDTFLRVIGAGVVEHNARVGRRTMVCQGRSFDAVFAESYAASPIRRATADKSALWLLAAEAISVSRVDGTITLLGNRFFGEFLHGWRGEKVVVRFDPQSLQDDLRVYRPDGGYLGLAACIEAVGFNDVAAARRDNQNRNSWMKGEKMRLAAERKMSIDALAAMLPKGEPAAPMAPPKIVRLVNGPSLALAAPREDAGLEQSEDERLMIAGVRRLRLVRNEEDELA